MFNKGRFSKFVVTSLMGAAIVFGAGSNAFAYSDSNSAGVPGLSSHEIESNVWISTGAYFQTQSYQVSAKFLGQNPDYGDWVKTAWDISASGLGVSIGGVSGGTASGNHLTGTWTNNDTWISDYSGTYNISGVPYKGTATNTASVFVDGTKASSTASTTRLY
ncbi:hypothetical protein N781_08970 [Pontibacillus halophilus JSM 076056 = DSM 19796]|uniref:Uncharacterized protein n=1 Tax=Pontibacillus halophilus JSM 076056 = DSM 19796 TaxID=1385510 RepID=A0A0A5GCS4_9BACI|nr:hypothetical protein [Pontibacillus halophilus]KGX89839.1 hypothetical protein N781_08970 [Pontibacillus halophilus JSM 076056 = DSM 19796]